MFRRGFIINYNKSCSTNDKSVHIEAIKIVVAVTCSRGVTLHNLCRIRNRAGVGIVPNKLMVYGPSLVHAGQLRVSFPRYAKSLSTNVPCLNDRILAMDYVNHSSFTGKLCSSTLLISLQWVQSRSSGTSECRESRTTTDDRTPLWLSKSALITPLYF